MKQFFLCVAVSQAALLFLVLPAHADCYQYDELGRLQNVIYGDAQAVTAKKEYHLDEHGNRESTAIDTITTENCPTPNGENTMGSSEPVGSDQFLSQASNNGENSPPVPDNENVAMLPDTTHTMSPLIGDTDPDGDQLSLVSVSSNQTTVTAVKNGDNVEITTYSNSVNATLSYVVSDGNGGNSTGYIFVTITEPEPGSGGDPDGYDPETPLDQQ